MKQTTPKALNQRAMLFSYLQDNKQPAAATNSTTFLQVFEQSSENINGGIAADVTYVRIISIWLYPPTQHRVKAESGYITGITQKVETYRNQIKNNDGHRFLYLPDIRGGTPEGIYRISEWSNVQGLTTGGRNNIQSSATFLPTDSFIVPVATLRAEYDKLLAASGLPPRNRTR